MDKRNMKNGEYHREDIKNKNYNYYNPNEFNYYDSSKIIEIGWNILNKDFKLSFIIL